MTDVSQSANQKTSISPVLSAATGRRRSGSTRRRFHPMRRKARRLGAPVWSWGIVPHRGPDGAVVANQALQKVPWFSAVPQDLFIFIGVCEFLGGVGLILPAMTGVKPRCRTGKA